MLARIEKDRDITAIPAAFYLLTKYDPALRLRAARSITKLVIQSPVIRLAKLDSLFRERTSMEWYRDWKREDPADLIALSLSEAERTIILGLASFHPNGYYREKAVRALSGITTGVELPFLVIRLNDWVAAISEQANVAILRRLDPQNARAIIHALPLIFRLRSLSRYSFHIPVYASIAVLAKPEARSELELGLRSKDGMIRRCCFQAIIEAKIYDNPTLLEHLLKEPSPTIRSFVLQRIRANLTPEDIRSYRFALLRDRSAPVRLAVLRVLGQFDLAEIVEDLKLAVLDENRAIREAARYLMRKHDDTFDFPAFYRESLLDPSADCQGAISGLGDTGQADDIKFITPFFEADKVRLVRSSMRAMAKLDFPKTKETLIAFLADARPGVVKEARWLLNKRINAADAEIIHEKYYRNAPDSLRRHAAILLCSLGKWDALRYLLEISTDSSDAIAQIGRSALSGWPSDRSSITPTKTQLKASLDALNKYGSVLSEKDRRLIEFSLKGYL